MGIRGRRAEESASEVTLHQHGKAAAMRRLEDAKEGLRRADESGDLKQVADALRELTFALAVAEEWFLAGKAGRL